MSVIDDLNDEIGDIQDSQSSDEDTLSDHETRIGTVEDNTTNLDPNRINQLNFPLDQDTQDLITGLISQSVLLSGVVQLVSGSYTITDTRINGTSKCFITSFDAPGKTYQMSASANGGSALITSSSGADTNRVNYLIVL